MNRRTFVIEAGKPFAVVIGATYLIACGSSPATPSSVADVSSTSTVVNSHTHTATIPASDQLHPLNQSYTTSSSASHTHMVTLTASQLSTIGNGGSITVTSTVSTVTGSHSHDFTFVGKKM